MPVRKKLLKIKISYHDGMYTLEDEVHHTLPLAWSRIRWTGPHSRIIRGVLKIKAGYQFDGSSVVGDVKGTLVAALIHDAMYEVLRGSSLGFFMRGRLRHAADKVFLGEMISRDTKVGVALTRFIAVRLFGWIFSRESAESKALTKKHEQEALAAETSGKKKKKTKKSQCTDVSDK